jgi:hypothetical protein
MRQNRWPGQEPDDRRGKVRAHRVLVLGLNFCSVICNQSCRVVRGIYVPFDDAQEKRLQRRPP